MAENVRIYTHEGPRPAPEAASGGRKAKRARGRLSRGDRLLRNTAIACALLLGVLTLGNLDLPWARKASEGIEQALTMRINLDESIGELTFVRQIMPESALVFLNVTGAPELTRPAAGEVTHPWSNAQPWLMFACAEGEAVLAPAEGTVTAVSPLSEGRYGLIIDHGGGLETVLSNLDQVGVQAGDAVKRGDALGVCSDSLYLEYRAGGEPVDPSEKLGLA